jgi:DNA-binding transcriptional regulator PaaX
MSNLKQKILLLLLGGIVFGYSYTPQRQWKIVKTISKEWKKIDKKELHQQIRNLYKSKLIERKVNPDGTYTFILTEKGKLRALTYNFENMDIEKKSWDGKWRIVAFDIPEKLKVGRDALRAKLKKLGFMELQKSVFVFPYECKDEIDFVIEFFDIRKYARYGTMDFIDNDIHLRNMFELK